MISPILALVLLCLWLRSSSCTPMAQPPTSLPDKDIVDGRRALQAAVCAEDYVQVADIVSPTFTTSSNDARLAGRPALPNPHDYTYEVYALYQKHKIPKSYLAYLVQQFDVTAQKHSNFDEPIPAEGYIIRLDHDLVQLQIKQEGDNNLVWGNVKNAIIKMKNHYADPKVPSQTDFVEVAIQDGFLLEGYVRMVEEVCSLKPKYV